MLKSTRLALAIGAAAALGLLGARKPLQEAVVQQIVLHKDAPTEEAFDEVMDNAWSPRQMLQALWDVGKIQHRHYAIGFLHDNATFAHANWAAVRPMVLGAIASKDIDLQQPALAVLGREEPELAQAVAVRFTADIDPEIRLLGLRGLEAAQDRKSLETYINCLSDSDSNVMIFADLALRRTTAKTVAIDYRDPGSVKAAAVQWQTYVDAQAPASPGASPVVAVSAPAGSVAAPAGARSSGAVNSSSAASAVAAVGVTGAVASANPQPAAASSATSPVSADPAALPAPAPMPAADFSLKDVNGAGLKLTDFRGEPVLLNFWSTGCGPCIAEMPSLALFQSRHPGVQVIGICVDAVPDDDGDSVPQPDPTPRVKEILSRQGVHYRMAVDPEGKAVGPYDGSGVPLNIFIDGNGNITRRFIGPRSQGVLDQMLVEAGGEVVGR